MCALGLNSGCHFCKGLSSLSLSPSPCLLLFLRHCLSLAGEPQSFTVSTLPSRRDCKVTWTHLTFYFCGFWGLNLHPYKCKVHYQLSYFSSPVTSWVLPVPIESEIVGFLWDIESFCTNYRKLCDFITLYFHYFEFFIYLKFMIFKTIKCCIAFVSIVLFSLDFWKQIFHGLSFRQILVGAPSTNCPIKITSSLSSLYKIDTF